MGVPREHSYAVTVSWTGNHGTGTSSYRDYGFIANSVNFPVRHEPLVTAEGFAAEAHWQSRAVAAGAAAEDDQAFVDSVSDWPAE